MEIDKNKRGNMQKRQQKNKKTNANLEKCCENKESWISGIFHLVSFISITLSFVIGL